MSVYAVIMAGGSGTRFWPLSRAKKPKQLLPLGPTNEPLIAATVRRIRPIVSENHILIVTSEIFAEAISELLPNIPKENILCEPVGRNTAPCIGWAAAHIARIDPTAVMMVLPSDHHIEDENGFVRVCQTAINEAVSGDLVTIGITPTRPETGYGYLEMGECLHGNVFRVSRFIEKPNLQTAENFFSSGNYLWNGGMFFFRVDSILSAIAQYLPELSKSINELNKSYDSKSEKKFIREHFHTLASISIDHGVMEKSAHVSVVPGNFGWSDVGTWTTAWELASHDDDGNALPTDAIAIDATNNFVHTSSNKLITLIGVDDLVVVETEDALLIMPRMRAQDVRSVVETLHKRGDHRL